MILDTFSILFYLKTGKENKNGETVIYCRITIRGKRAEFSTKRSVIKNQWDKAKGRVRGKSEIAKSINSYLEAITNKLHQTQGTLIEKDEIVSAIQLKNIFLGNSEKTKSLIEAFDFHNLRMKELVGTEFALGTYNRYKTTLSHVKEFLLSFYRTDDILLKKLDHTFIADFDFHLRKNRDCSNNTAVRYVHYVRKIANLSIKNNWLDRDPFVHFEGKIKWKRKSFLTETELETLEKKFFLLPD